MKNMICFAHRGASGYEPENTLLAINRAIEIGMSWIEIDVRNVEHELIVFHDKDLERTTNGKGLVSERSLEYIRSLDAGKGEKIPFLQEVLDATCDKSGINIELKGEKTVDQVSKLISEYISNGKIQSDKVIVSSFIISELEIFKSLNPDIRIAPIFRKNHSGYEKTIKILAPYSAHFHRKSVTEEIVNKLHEHNVKVYVYTVNTVEELSRMVKLKVDGIFTNYPDLIT